MDIYLCWGHMTPSCPHPAWTLIKENKMPRYLCFLSTLYHLESLGYLKSYQSSGSEVSPLSARNDQRLGPMLRAFYFLSIYNISGARCGTWDLAVWTQTCYPQQSDILFIWCLLRLLHRFFPLHYQTSDWTFLSSSFSIRENSYCSPLLRRGRRFN